MLKVWFTDSFWSMNGLLLGRGKISENKHLEACITTWHWCNIQIYSSSSSNLYFITWTHWHCWELSSVYPEGHRVLQWGRDLSLSSSHHIPFKPCWTGPRGGSPSLASLFMCTPTPKGHISNLSWEPSHYTQLQMQQHHGNYGFPQLSNHSAREWVPSDVFLQFTLTSLWEIVLKLPSLTWLELDGSGGRDGKLSL